MRALARAVSLVESQSSVGRELVAGIYAHTGRALMIGITGPPGAGKSTLVNQLTRHLRGAGKTVGIIAIDPSSAYSHGALLGDRIRMQDHHGDPGVFIRSMATRGSLGGIARTTLEVALLLDGAGRDVVLIETVGVGQDEIEIARLADVTVVVLMPGMGDDVQAIKAGMMEIADVFAINKSDLPGADNLEQDLRAMQSVANEAGGTAAAPIRRVIASEGQGIDELLAAIRDVAQTRGRQNSRAKTATSVEIDHLGIAVTSLDEALRFYETTLGIQSAGREMVEAERVKVAMLPAGASRIELLEASGNDSAIARFIEKRGPGLHHIALRVDDLSAAVARLKTHGAHLLNEPRPGAGGHMYVFVHPSSTGGVLLELIQK